MALEEDVPGEAPLDTNAVIDSLPENILPSDSLLRDSLLKDSLLKDSLARVDSLLKDSLARMDSLFDARALLQVQAKHQLLQKVQQLTHLT